MKLRICSFCSLVVFVVSGWSPSAFAGDDREMVQKIQMLLYDSKDVSIVVGSPKSSPEQVAAAPYSAPPASAVPAQNQNRPTAAQSQPPSSQDVTLVELSHLRNAPARALPTAYTASESDRKRTEKLYVLTDVAGSFMCYEVVGGYESIIGLERITDRKGNVVLPASSPTPIAFFIRDPKTGKVFDSPVVVNSKYNITPVKPLEEDEAYGEKQVASVSVESQKASQPPVVTEVKTVPVAPIPALTFKFERR